ncbi:hypothetical protein GGS20DRAFT_543555 [Poronia punctata]|nr:hypothetical protein GGS20DRAFT_543555 [Poronia punctata]
MSSFFFSPLCSRASGIRRAFSRLASLRFPDAYTNSTPPAGNLDILAKNVDLLAPQLWDEVTGPFKNTWEIEMTVKNVYHIMNPEGRLKIDKHVFKGRKNRYGIILRQSHEHCYTNLTTAKLKGVEHPRLRPILDKAVARNQVPLWIQVGAGYLKVQKTSAPRITAAKRLRKALLKALDDAGFDSEGRRKVANGESSAIVDLYGTVNIRVQDSIGFSLADQAEVDEIAEHVVHHIIMNSRRYHQGQRRGDPQKGMWRQDSSAGSRSRHYPSGPKRDKAPGKTGFKSKRRQSLE